MIRLTEIDRSTNTVTVKLEGYITATGLRLLDQAFAQYRRAQITQLQLHVDDLQSISFHALQELAKVLPNDIQVDFHTNRSYLKDLLATASNSVARAQPDISRAQSGLK